MKTIVLGGSGFIGGHVADVLSDRGHDVSIFDLQEAPHVRKDQLFIQGDLLDERAVRKAIQGHEIVYNFAGLADLDEAQDHPIDTIRQNVLSNGHALEASRLAGVSRYILASTIYVYSDKGSFYRASKQACELYVEEYSRRFGLDYSILRYGSLYGPRANRFNSIHKYLRQALTEGKIVGYGTGDEMREYIHVRDAASLSVDILDNEFRNQHVLLTGHHSMRLRDLLKMIQEITGNNVQVELIPPSENGTTGARAAHYAVTPYNFQPKVGKKLTTNYFTDLGQGLLECIDEVYRSEALRKSEAGNLLRK